MTCDSRCRAYRWILVVALGAAGPAAAEDGTTRPDVSSSMTWEQIGRAMEAYPPAFDHGDRRLKIMQSMDRLISFSVKHVPDEERPKLKPKLEAMVEFYRRRADRGLAALERTRVTEGVHVFKF